MRLGIGSYTYPWAVGVPGHPPERPLSALDLLEKAAESGVHVLQVADNLPLDQLSASDLEAFERRASDVNVAIEVGTRGIAPAHLRTYLQLARRFKSPILRVVVDTAQHQADRAEVVTRFRAMLPEFEAAGVVLAIENHDRFTVRDLIGILQEVNSPALGICLDTVNSFGALEGPEAVVTGLAPWVVNLHVKDFTIFRAGHLMGFTIEGRPAGQGRLNVPWLLQQLREAGRDVNAILELWTPPEETLAATIAKEERWARHSLEYLRTLMP